MPRVSTLHGLHFDADNGESMLDAALRAGLALPYSCRTGRCSTCKCRVTAGSTRALHDELGLTAEERAGGWILGCVRSAIGDVTLDVEDLGGMQLALPRTTACRIHSLERAAGDVLRIQLRLPPGATFDYEPGQYIEVIGAGGIRRSYSIANAKNPQRLIELHVREVEAGMLSAYWFGPARANDLLRLHGPLGTFFLRDVAGRDLVFLATGTGIAPVKAMLEALACADVQARPRSVAVYWGGRHRQDLYWRTESVDLPHRYVPVLSRADETWSGARGHVQDVFLRDAPDLAQCRVYACGSDAMIHAARALLVASGLPERAFHSDAFVCSAAV